MTRAFLGPCCTLTHILFLGATAAWTQEKLWTFGSGVDLSGPFQVIAEAKGLFDKHGVKVSVHKFSSATLAFRCVRSEETLGSSLGPARH